MATALKDYFDDAVIRGIGRDVAAAYPRFDRKTFEADCLDGLALLSLTDRARHVARALTRHLPADFPQAARILEASLGPELTSTETFGMAPFRYLPHVFFVAEAGLGHLEPALRLQYQLTKRFSAEYSIRVFLEKYPDETYARLVTWTADPSPHVRRLTSEGTRPRLPWAPRLRAYQRDPAPVIALLERLKDDPELYVRRSVANNLNDIGKDHPALLIEVCQRWAKDENASPERAWIIRHALRSLIKRGDRAALALLGCAEAPRVRVEDAHLTPARLREGDRLTFACDLVSTGRTPQTLMADFVVHFVKANGKTVPKVFKLKQTQLAPRARLRLEGRVSFAPLTTRQHFPGVHRLDLLINGVTFPLGEVRLLPGRAAR